MVSAPAVRVPSAAARPAAVARGSRGGFFGCRLGDLADGRWRRLAAAAVLRGGLRFGAQMVALGDEIFGRLLTSSGLSGVSVRGGGMSWTAGKATVSAPGEQPDEKSRPRPAIATAREQPRRHASGASTLVLHYALRASVGRRPNAASIARAVKKYADAQ